MTELVSNSRAEADLAMARSWCFNASLVRRGNKLPFMLGVYSANIHFIAHDSAHP